jgi:hypothetical protein
MSTYSSDLKLELIATGDASGTWGSDTNNNLNLIQQAIAGFEQVTLSSGGTLALAMTNKTLSNARNMVIRFATASIAASTICTIPDSIEKFYIFDATGLTNPTNLTIKTASGSGFTLDAAKIYAAYSDGTNLKEVSLDTLGGTIGSAQIADDAITTAKIADDAITSALIADDAVVAAGIADNAVVTAGINNDAVTAAKLADTSVSAGSYTLSSITVDAQGRLTAASNGSASASNLVGTFGSVGPSSGNYTASPGANFIVAYIAGGGGGGGRTPGSVNGGAGGFGVYATPISQPYTKAYSVGDRGNGQQGQGSSGNAGGATNFGSPITVAANGGGGGGGPGGSAGSQGTVNGATKDLTNVGTSSKGTIMNQSLRKQMGFSHMSTSPSNFNAVNGNISLSQGGPIGNINSEGGEDGGFGFLYIYENIGS